MAEQSYQPEIPAPVTGTRRTWPLPISTRSLAYFVTSEVGVNVTRILQPASGARVGATAITKGEPRSIDAAQAHGIVTQRWIFAR